MPTPDFHAQFQAIQEQYRATLPDRLANMQSAWQALKNASPNEDRHHIIESLYRNVHGITGTAGTFNLAEMSQACRAFESFLKLIRKQHEPLSDHQLTDGERLLHACLNAL